MLISVIITPLFLLLPCSDPLQFQEAQSQMRNVSAEPANARDGVEGGEGSGGLRGTCLGKNKAAEWPVN